MMASANDKNQMISNDIQSFSKRLHANDPFLEELDVTMFPMNDAMAAHLGTALAHNTELVQLDIHIMPTILTVSGARALVAGIQQSSLRKLVIECNEELPKELDILYTETIPKVKRLQLLLPLCNYHATRLGECLTPLTSMEQLGLIICSHILLPRLGTIALAKGIRRAKIMNLELMGNSNGEDIAADNMGVLFEHGVQGHPTLQYLNVFGRIGDMECFCAAVVDNVMCLTLLETRDELGDLSELEQFCKWGLAPAVNLFVLRMVDCGLGDEHLSVLTTTGRMGHHPVLQKFDINKQKQLASLLREICLTQNNIGGIGAQALVRASATHPKLARLDLSDNQAIGYDGLILIGKELANAKMQVLDLHHVVVGGGHGNAKCEEASQALLEGMRTNKYLVELNMDGVKLVPRIQLEIDALLKSNRERQAQQEC